MAEESKEQRGTTEHGARSGGRRFFAFRIPHSAFLIRSMSARGRLVALLISLCCVVLVLLLWRMERSGEPFFRFFRLAELSSLNARFLTRGPLKPSGEVVIVELDETTIEEADSYPLPRGVFGRLVDRLVEAGAKVIVFDILFLQPQNKEELEQIDRLIASWESIPEPQRSEADRAHIAELKRTRAEIDEDGKLAAALDRAAAKGTWVISAMNFVNKKEAEGGFRGRPLTEQERRFLHNFVYLQKEPKSAEARNEMFKVYPPVEMDGAVPIILRLAEKCAGIGYVDFTPDDDGVLRYETLVARFDDNFFMPLSVMSMWMFLDPNPQQLWVKFTEGVQIAGIDIPANAKNRMLINYCGPSRTFPTYSLCDVVNTKIAPEAFKGKLVFVGGTAEGIGDRIVTPFSARLPGVEKHASVADNILTRRFIQRTLRTVTGDVAAIVAIGLAMGILLPILSPVAGLILTMALEAGWLVFAQYAFCKGVWHNVVYPSLAIFLSFGLITLYRFAVEEKKRREAKRLFDRYMDPAVLDELLENVDKIKLGGDSMTITCLFSDVAGFTRISENLKSGQLIDLLNRYFTPLTDIILKHGGFINKYQGDAIVAAFCVPIEKPDHTVRACSAAIDCQKRLTTLNQELAAAGFPAMPTRIGLSSGVATVGNIGSAKKLEYTVIGDSINLGQRLEAANKEFGTRVLIGGYTFHGAREHIAVRDLGLITVVGRDKPVRIYELLDYAGNVSDELLKLTAVFERGLACFQKRQWDDAMDRFREALTIVNDDGPSKRFIELCEQFKQDPPPDGWDGSIAMAGK